MTDRKATHQGECQLCSHTQKLPKGKLALHGYSVRWSSFIGTCPGSRHLPIEISCDLLKDARDRALRVAASLLKDADAIAEETERVWVHEYHPATWARGQRQSRYEWREILVADLKSVTRSRVEWVRENGKLDHVDLYPTPNASSDPIENLNWRKAVAVRKEASEYEAYAAWLDQRLANWAPKAVRAIEDAPVDPTVCPNTKPGWTNDPQMYRRYGQCDVCGNRAALTKYGQLRKHRK